MTASVRNDILSSWRRTAAAAALIASFTPLATVAAVPDGPFVAFESGQVEPLAQSTDGRFLFATNTPDNRLEILRILPGELRHVTSVPVGMEPVSVTVRSSNEVWVTNLLSDSVSIVRLDGAGIRVVRTLQTGDEPRQVVFAGPDNRFAFVTAAHRAFERTDQTGNADIWVFDTQDLGEPAGGEPVAILNLFTDIPRALAVSPDGNTVYAAGFMTGNRTSIVSSRVVQGDLPPPLANVEGVPAPDVGLIVRNDGERWLDGAGRDLSNKVDFNITDYDVFVIDASGDLPVVTDRIEGVGTSLFNIAVNPQSGDLYVSNLEARNEVRFEGPGELGGSTVRGHFAESRITVIDADTGEVLPRHLNKHIDYSRLPGTEQERAASLALPTDIVVSDDGETLYVAAFGSSKVGRLPTAALRDDTFVPRPALHFDVGGGPSGLVLDQTRNRLYVLTRFDNAVSALNLQTGAITAQVSLFNPEPPSITEGRRFLYDARYTSSHGDSACAGCHIYGDKDELAWDLGNPDALVEQNPNPQHREALPGESFDFHPMKGPLTTQSLRGMADNGPMHWRGDRTGGSDPGGDPLDENAAFLAFNGAFDALLGRENLLTDEEMQAFADFALQLFYPPNPLRALDNSLDNDQGFGRQVFNSKITVPASGDRCNDCHRLSPEEELFGTSAESVVRDQQAIKTPHLRNLYTKISLPETDAPPPFERFRGFGFRHTGELPKMTQLLEAFDIGDAVAVRQMAEFMMVFDTNLAPVVGQQVTLSGALPFDDKLLTMVDRATQGGTPECDLIVKGKLGGVSRGWFLLENGRLRSDIAGEALLSFSQLIANADVPGQELTFTCAPPGSGVRMGIDRDLDGTLDGDELATARTAVVGVAN
jgi:DNA-binding beta-propeller fold protein YncE